MRVTPRAEELLSELEKAASGLLFPSESDYPLTPYRWISSDGAELSPEALLQSEGRPQDTPLETITVEDLFGPLTKVEEGASEEEKAEACRYQALVDLLARELSDVRVYRVGKVDIDVYILGRQRSSGEWLGLKTRVVET